MKKILYVILLFSSQICSSFAADTETTKEIWTALMLDVLPEKFCEKNAYFSQCFKINNKDCKDLILKATQRCFELNSKNIPSILNKKDGDKWGGTIGICTGSIFENALKEYKISNKKCTDFNSRDWE